MYTYNLIIEKKKKSVKNNANINNEIKKMRSSENCTKRDKNVCSTRFRTNVDFVILLLSAGKEAVETENRAYNSGLILLGGIFVAAILSMGTGGLSLPVIAAYVIIL